MENKTLSESERALLRILRGEADNGEEFDWLEAELARFSLNDMEVSDGTNAY
jgi:hypothetical protein